MQPSNQSRPHSTASSRTSTRAFTCCVAGTSSAVQSRWPMSSISASRILRSRACSRVSLDSNMVWYRSFDKLRMTGGAVVSRRADVAHQPRLLRRARVARDEVEHALDAAERVAAHRLVDVDFAAALLEARDHALQRVHRHPRAVPPALAGGAVA